MTGEQKMWLDSRSAEGYRPMGRPPGAQARYVRIGMLYPDGSFELKRSREHRYEKAILGMFEVGVLEMT